MNSILYIGCDIPDGNAAAIRVFSNAKALYEYGYKVYILSFDHSTLPKSNNLIDGIEVIHKHHPNSSTEYLRHLVDYKTYANLIDELMVNNKLDAVIAYELPGISFFRLKQYCKRKKISLICDCAGWHTAIHLHGIAKIVKMLDVCISMRFSYKKADGIIVISNYLKDYYYKRFSGSLIQVPPLQYKKSSRHEFFTRSPRRFIYAGVAGKDKDCLDAILEAFSLLTDRSFVLDLYGLTEDDCVSVWPKTLDYITSIRSHAEVYFHGRQPHNVIINKTIASDFSILVRNATRKNNAGFPTKFGESIECGTPVIATEFSDVVQYINDYNLGLVVSDKDNLHLSLKAAIDMPDQQLLLMKIRCYNSLLFNYSSYITILGEFIHSMTKK